MGKSQDKGEAFKYRIISLFSKILPFEWKTIPKRAGEKEERYYLTPNKKLMSKIDVTIKKESEVFLVIECKKVSTLPTIADIADRLIRIKTDQKAKSGLIIISGAEISQDIICDIYKKYKLYVWNDELLSYYEKIASTLGSFAFFEIINSLGIKLEEESGDEFKPAVRLEQEIVGDKLELISFTASPQSMIPKTYVFRHANKRARSYQRLLNKAKLKEISEYIMQGGKIINSIILLLPKECKFLKINPSKKDKENWYYGNIKGALGRLKIPKKYCFIEIIDGQHRLYSFTKCEEKIRKGFPLNFIGIIGGNKELARDLFITVNQRAKKIEANLLAAIQEEYDKKNLTKPESLSREIVRYLNRARGSELKKQILESERLTPKQHSLKIYIAMLSYHGIKPLIQTNGSLNKLIKKTEVKPYYKIINKYLKRIKEVFPKEYENNEKYVVFTNNGLIPLLRLLGNICDYYKKQPSQRQIDEILTIIKDYTWDLEHIRERSSGAGWKKTYDELIKKINTTNRFKNFPKR